MIVRVLEKQEYSTKLDAIEEGFVPDPENSIAVVAEENGQIIGRMLLVLMPHLEATWIAQENRGGTAGYRMEKEMIRAATERRIPHLLAFTSTIKDSEYMQRLGWKLEPYQVLSKEVPCP